MQQLSTVPEEDEFTEHERQQALLSAYFPHLSPTPATPATPAPHPAPRSQPPAFRALKFSTLLPSARIVGVTDGNAEVYAQQPPITDVLKQEFSKLSTKLRSEMKTEVRAELKLVGKEDSKIDASLEKKTMRLESRLLNQIVMWRVPVEEVEARLPQSVKYQSFSAAIVISR